MEDFNILKQVEFRDGMGTHAHNDPNVICSDVAKGVLLSIQGFDFATDFFALDANLKFSRLRLCKIILEAMVGVCCMMYIKTKLFKWAWHMISL